MNEQKVYLNPLNQILHDFYFIFFSDGNSDISKSVLCASTLAECDIKGLFLGSLVAYFQPGGP